MLNELLDGEEVTIKCKRVFEDPESTCEGCIFFKDGDWEFDWPIPHCEELCAKNTKRNYPVVFVKAENKNII